MTRIALATLVVAACAGPCRAEGPAVGDRVRLEVRERFEADQTLTGAGLPEPDRLVTASVVEARLLATIVAVDSGQVVRLRLEVEAWEERAGKGEHARADASLAGRAGELFRDGERRGWTLDDLEARPISGAAKAWLHRLALDLLGGASPGLDAREVVRAWTQADPADLRERAFQAQASDGRATWVTTFLAEVLPGTRLRADAPGAEVVVRVHEQAPRDRAAAASAWPGERRVELELSGRGRGQAPDGSPVEVESRLRRAWTRVGTLP